MGRLLSVLCICLLQHIQAQHQIQLPAELSDAEFNTDQEWPLATELRGIDLNKAESRLLMDAGILSGSEWQRLQSHIAAHGRLLHLLELQSIDGFDSLLIRRLLPHICVDCLQQPGPIGWRSLRSAASHEWLNRLVRSWPTAPQFVSEREVDGRPADYAGSPLKWLMRYRMSLNRRLSAGFVLEKDAGEAVAAARSLGFDHFGFHLLLRQFRKLDLLALGDFRINFGQGLIAWQGFTIGKALDPAFWDRGGARVEAHRSSAENGFMRGFAAEGSAGRWNWLFFVSRLRQDARLDSLARIEQLFSSGYHRTQTEMKARNATARTAAGAGVDYGTKSLQIGLKLLPYIYDHAFTSAREDQSALNGSFHLRWISARFHLAAETAFHSSGSASVLACLLTHPHPDFSFGLLLRHFGSDYRAAFANAFSESGRVQGESGLALGLDWHSRQWRVLLQVDGFSVPLKEGYGKGLESILHIERRKGRSESSYLRYSMQRKSELLGSEARLSALQDYRRHRLRIQWNQALTEDWSVRFRAEGCLLDRVGIRKAWLLYQDFRFRPRGSSWKLSSRLAVFYSEDARASVYAYENDVRYAFRIPAYHGRGWRWYLLSSVKLRGRLDLSVRFSLWSRQETAVSGRYERAVPRMSPEWSTQLIYTLN